MVSQPVALHEVYFDSLGGDGAVLFTGVGSGSKMAQPIGSAIEQQFGSLASWKRDSSRWLADLVGWSSATLGTTAVCTTTLCSYRSSASSGILSASVWAFSSAYQRQFGANAVACIDAFIRNVDGAAVGRRFAQAGGPRSPTTSTGDQSVPAITAEELLEARARDEPLQVIDARYLSGGLSAWYAAGGARALRPAV